jgi:hypothetical protein
MTQASHGRRQHDYKTRKSTLLNFHSLVLVLDNEADANPEGRGMCVVSNKIIRCAQNFCVFTETNAICIATSNLQTNGPVHSPLTIPPLQEALCLQLFISSARFFSRHVVGPIVVKKEMHVGDCTWKMLVSDVSSLFLKKKFWRYVWTEREHYHKNGAYSLFPLFCKMGLNICFRTSKLSWLKIQWQLFPEKDGNCWNKF